MKEPTQEQCRGSYMWNDEDGFSCMAFYWPQMGGYSAKAVARTGRESKDNCVTVFVWHDGEFPFTESDRDFNDKVKSPAILHICDFGDWLQTMELLSRFQGNTKG